MLGRLVQSGHTMKATRGPEVIAFSLKRWTQTNRPFWIMNESEAKLILMRELSRYRKLSYTELLALLGSIETCERASPSGITYQVELEVFFVDAKQNVYVMGCIDDGGWRAFKPLCGDFIVAPDGSFVGE
jgi:hypothetical protein